jgi:hypothetical protein
VRFATFDAMLAMSLFRGRPFRGAEGTPAWSAISGKTL